MADQRQPVSFQLLQDLGGLLIRLCKSGYEDKLFRVAFLGALRLGELVCPSTNRAGGLRDEDVDLFWDRVEFYLWSLKWIHLIEGVGWFCLKSRAL